MKHIPIFTPECWKSTITSRTSKPKKSKKQMDDVIDAYRKTHSLNEASIMANISYDTVQ